VFALGSGVVVAKKTEDRRQEQVRGTKKQRKQKMAKREITDEQFAAMIGQLKKALSVERELMKQTIVNRLSRKYEGTVPRESRSSTTS
jgi:hypothetical protein